jgi:hypothetical protein
MVSSPPSRRPSRFLASALARRRREAGVLNDLEHVADLLVIERSVALQDDAPLGLARVDVGELRGEHLDRRRRLL